MIKIKGSQELFGVLVLLASAIIALLTPSIFMSYVVILVSGIAAGRIVYNQWQKQNHTKDDIGFFIIEEFPYIIMILAFMVGYILGNIQVSKVTLLVLFIASFTVSYYFHYKGVYRYN